jgi:cell division protein FtsQ
VSAVVSVEGPRRRDAADAGDAAGAREPGEERQRPAARPRRRWRAAVGLLLLLGVVGGAASAPRWGPGALSRLAFFRVRRVVIDGARYAAPGELLARLQLDTTRSVWAPAEPLVRRLRAHPLVADARVERQLPGTLRIVVTERQPVAMTVERGEFAVYDVAGARLPIDPSRVGGIDAPLIAARDTALLRLFAALRADAPRLFARVSEARRVGRDELALTVAAPPGRAGAGGGARPTVLVRAMADVSAGRLADLLPVEDDLVRRRARVAELDLRYRDQVIARLQ